MSFSHAKLRGRIREVYETEGRFAQELGITPTALSRKLIGKNDFTRTEIEITSKCLGIDPVDIAQYFFSSEFVNTNNATAAGEVSP